MIENEKPELKKLFEEWVRLLRLSGGVRDDADIAVTRKGALDLSVRMVEPCGPLARFVDIAADILWAQMIPVANSSANPRDVPIIPEGGDPRVTFGALARSQPDGAVRAQLERAAGMQARVFQAGMTTLASLQS